MRRRTLVGGMLAATMLVACDDDGPDGSRGGSGASDDGGASGAGADAPPRTSVPVLYGPVEIDVAIVSVARSGEHLVLTLELTADDPDGDLGSGPVDTLQQLVSGDYGQARAFDGLRLLDLDGDRVAVIAMDADGRSIRTEPEASWSERSGAGDSERVQLVYGDLGVEEVAVLVPKGGLLESIPVVDEELPDAGAETPVDLSAVDSAPVAPLTSFSRDLTTTTRTESSEESTTVSLGSDVLFESSSAELNGSAQAVIEDAARTLAEHEPGPVQVVGHTDSVDDEAFNQALSEERAQAVTDVLGTLVDDAEYPLEASGKGEGEPVADNGTDEGRTLNRRVELSIDTPLAEEQASTGELPEFEGQDATGEEGVELTESGTTPYRVRAPGARLVQDHLVVTLEFTRLDEKIDSVSGIQDSTGSAESWLPTGHELIKTEGGIAVMDGPVATLPVLHHMGDEGSAIRPLTDLRTNSRLDGGVTRVSEIVYPAGLAVEDTVTLQLGEKSWRLTDVPVTR
ncbi:OmpA family protein [Brachybacterium alimentarium]|uniref:OmpA family protein n=1 Tax=Brachybacterium alimentarium TaxID=47845 RepID=UPI000DF1F648|nr:OmpA family protein [Brachybacterium alimentarium]RCS78683.1 OmpA family protein [Brachybacterium alimentarium]